MKPYHFIATALALFLSVHLPAVADESAAATSANRATAEQIDQWIEDLDSNKFLVRENATQKLADGSMAVLEQLEQAVRTGSLEKSIRCIHVLRSYVLGEDIDLEMAAIQRIEAIAESGEDRVANYAGEVLKKIKPLQQERSTRLLSNLGVQFSSYGPQGGFMGAGASGPNIVLDENYEGTAKQLYYLRQLDYIQDVVITGDKVTGEWLDQVAEMPNVQLMTVMHCPVDSAMLKKLEPLFPKLLSLRLYYIDVDREAIPSLMKLTSMRRGEFYGLDFSAQDKARLRAALPPHIYLDFRNGGFLGVIADALNNNTTCRIDRVQAGSGAEEGGLRGDDVIIEVEGTAVQKFSDLTDQLKNYKVGDKVKFVIQRDNETLEKTITLGPWPYRAQYSLNP